MKRQEDREKKCWISNPSPTNLSPTTALFSPSRSASGQRSKSTNNMPSSTKYNVSRPQPTKARKRKIKKQRANTFSAKAYGDLRPQQNKDFMFAATPCFVIHAKYDPLLQPKSRRILAAFNTAPQYSTVTSVDGRVLQNEVATFKLGNLYENQMEFCSLNGNGWLYDSLIDMFLHVYVQDRYGARCFSSHFYNLLWYDNEEVENSSYEGLINKTHHLINQRPTKASLQARSWTCTDFMEGTKFE